MPEAAGVKAVHKEDLLLTGKPLLPNRLTQTCREMGSCRAVAHYPNNPPNIAGAETAAEPGIKNRAVRKAGEQSLSK